MNQMKLNSYETLTVGELHHLEYNEFTIRLTIEGEKTQQVGWGDAGYLKGCFHLRCVSM